MKKSVIVGISVCVLLLISGLAVGLYFLLRSSPQGAVATSTDECSEAAVEILKKGGSAVDSAVTAAFCQGVTVFQSSGMGGGFIATVYIKETGTFESLNAREIAPAKATKNMYQDDISSREGGLAVAIPTELKGLHELHKKYGKLKWEEVVLPAAEVAENGFKVTKYLSEVFRVQADKIKARPILREKYINPVTGEFYIEGDTLKLPKLANTLRVVAKEGADAFYGDGSFGQKLVDEIQADGGIITFDDLKNYQPKWIKSTVSTIMKDQKLSTFPLPASGDLVTFVLNIMNGFHVEDYPIEHHKEEKLLYHRLMEAFKFAFAKRTKIGDESTEEVLQTVAELRSLEHAEFIRSKIEDGKTHNNIEYYGANTTVQLDYGTGHLSIIAPNGDAVALTATINFIMGSYLMSESTGIIFNNEMNDFSIPIAASDGLLPAPGNFIVPGKSPMSSMNPMILLNAEGDVTMVLGGAGGILITTSIIQCIINYLYLNLPIQQAIDEKRLHHQLQPMRVRYEFGYDPEIIKFLASKDHVTYEQPTMISGFASVVGLVKKNGKIEGAIDPRRGGRLIVY